MSRLPRLSLFLIFTAGTLAWSAEPDAKRPWPLWDGQESVAEYAQRANLPPTKTLDLGNGVKLELVLIPAGEFIMGTPEPEKPLVGKTIVGVTGGILLVVIMVWLMRARKKRIRLQFSLAFLLLVAFVASFGVWGGVRWHQALQSVSYDDEYPAHKVALTRPYYIGKYEVTQEQYQQVMGTNPSYFKGAANLPVEQVSWDDAQEFCKKMGANAQEIFRLPTEAEWEFACRAGSTSAYCSGNLDDDLNRVAWYRANSNGKTHPVGQKEANRFGVYDMHGNIWEWCGDWYESYKEEPQVDSPGAKNGQYRVLRGGSWNYTPRLCRSAARNRSNPVGRDNNLGFRVVGPSFRTP